MTFRELMGLPGRLNRAATVRERSKRNRNDLSGNGGSIRQRLSPEKKRAPDATVMLKLQLPRRFSKSAATAEYSHPWCTRQVEHRSVSPQGDAMASGQQRCFYLCEIVTRFDDQPRQGTPGCVTQRWPNQASANGRQLPGWMTIPKRSTQLVVLQNCLGTFRCAALGRFDCVAL